jgi:hypothetical protein
MFCGTLRFRGNLFEQYWIMSLDVEVRLHSLYNSVLNIGLRSISLTLQPYFPVKLGLGTWAPEYWNLRSNSMKFNPPVPPYLPPTPPAIYAVLFITVLK